MSQFHYYWSWPRLSPAGFTDFILVALVTVWVVHAWSYLSGIISTKVACWRETQAKKAAQEIPDEVVALLWPQLSYRQLVRWWKRRGLFVGELLKHKTAWEMGLEEMVIICAERYVQSYQTPFASQQWALHRALDDTQRYIDMDRFLRNVFGEKLD